MKTKKHMKHMVEEWQKLEAYKEVCEHLAKKQTQPFVKTNSIATRNEISDLLASDPRIGAALLYVHRDECEKLAFGIATNFEHRRNIETILTGACKCVSRVHPFQRKAFVSVIKQMGWAIAFSSNPRYIKWFYTICTSNGVKFTKGDMHAYFTHAIMSPSNGSGEEEKLECLQWFNGVGVNIKTLTTGELFAMFRNQYFGGLIAEEIVRRNTPVRAVAVQCALIIEKIRNNSEHKNDNFVCVAKRVAEKHGWHAFPESVLVFARSIGLIDINSCDKKTVAKLAAIELANS